MAKSRHTSLRWLQRYARPSPEAIAAPASMIQSAADGARGTLEARVLQFPPGGATRPQDYGQLRASSGWTSSRAALLQRR